MRLREAIFPDGEDLPIKFVVTTTPQELALLYALMAKIAPIDITNKTNLEWGNLFSELSDDISIIMNRFYDGGPLEVCRAIDVHTLGKERNVGTPKETPG